MTFSIKEWCERTAISKSKFYRLPAPPVAQARPAKNHHRNTARISVPRGYLSQPEMTVILWDESRVRRG